MKIPDDHPLWRDALADATDPVFADRALAQTLTHTRRLRRQRQAARVVIGAACVALLAITVSGWLKPRETGRARLSDSPPASPATESASPEIRYLTDEELLARFPDDAVALIGPPEDRQFMFVNNHSAEPPR